MFEKKNLPVKDLILDLEKGDRTKEMINVRIKETQQIPTRPIDFSAGAILGTVSYTFLTPDIYTIV